MKLVKRPSPNHFNGRGNAKPDMICFHQTGSLELNTILNYYCNPAAQCCPNYVIALDGTVYEMVHPDNGAWANGTSDKPSDKKFYGYSLSQIVRDRKVNANYYTYSIEFVHCQWGNINEHQIAAAVALIKTVIMPHMIQNGVTPQIDRAHLVGHSDITPKTRDPERFNCPGKQFPYDEIIRRVLGQPQQVQQTLTTNQTTKKVTLAFDAAVRSAPSASSTKLGILKPGDTTTIVLNSDVRDKSTNYIYVRLAGAESRWIVRSAIK